MSRYKYCSVYGCMNKTKNISTSGLSFFRVPDDMERRREWLIAINREDLLDDIKKTKMYNYVCSEHFDDSEIITSISKRLKTDAVPTKLLSQKQDAFKLETKKKTKNKSTKRHSTPHLSKSSEDFSSDLSQNGHTHSHSTVNVAQSTARAESQTLEVHISSDHKVKIYEVYSSSQTDIHQTQPSLIQTDSNESLNKKTQLTTDLKNLEQKRKLQNDNKNDDCASKLQRLENKFIEIKQEPEQEVSDPPTR